MQDSAELPTISFSTASSTVTRTNDSRPGENGARFPASYLFLGGAFGGCFQARSA